MIIAGIALVKQSIFKKPISIRRASLLHLCCIMSLIAIVQVLSLLITVAITTNAAPAVNDLGNLQLVGAALALPLCVALALALLQRTNHQLLEDLHIAWPESWATLVMDDNILTTLISTLGLITITCAVSPYGASTLFLSMILSAPFTLPTALGIVLPIAFGCELFLSYGQTTGPNEALPKTGTGWPPAKQQIAWFSALTFAAWGVVILPLLWMATYWLGESYHLDQLAVSIIFYTSFAMSALLVHSRLSPLRFVGYAYWLIEYLLPPALPIFLLYIDGSVDPMSPTLAAGVLLLLIAAGRALCGTLRTEPNEPLSSSYS